MPYVRSAPIIVIGEALVDCFPDALVAGGAPFNVARNLGAFGAAPVMVTRIGSDERGQLLLAECGRFNLSLEGVQRDAILPTGQVAVMPDGATHKFIIGENVAWDAIDHLLAADIFQRLQPSIVCFGTLAQRAAQSRAAIAIVLEQARKAGALRVLDLNLRSGAANADVAEWSLLHADIAKVNDDELAQLFDWFLPKSTAAAREWNTDAEARLIGLLLEKFPLRHLIVTRGGNGYSAYDSNATLVAAGPCHATTITDTVGAGDAFTAAVILGEWLGWPLLESLDRANQFAADVCTVRGAVAKDPHFYERWASRWQLANARRSAGLNDSLRARSNC